MSVPASASFNAFSAASIFSLVVGRDLVGLLLEQLLGLEDERVGVVADLRLLARCAVLLGVRLGVLHHPVDLVLAERGAAGDGHLLLLAGAEVLGRHVHDAVGVDVERDLDLRHATRCRRDADELERAERLVAVRHVALALEHLDLHADGWLSSAVVNTSDRFVGIVVLRSMSLVMI